MLPLRRPEKQLGRGPLQLAPTKHSDRRCGVWWLGSSATFLLVLGGVLPEAGGCLPRGVREIGVALLLAPGMALPLGLPPDALAQLLALACIDQAHLPRHKLKGALVVTCLPGCCIPRLAAALLVSPQRLWAVLEAALERVDEPRESHQVVEVVLPQSPPTKTENTQGRSAQTDAATM